MKFIAWLGAFVLAAIGLVTAFVKVFEGSAKEVVALTRDVVKIQAEAATQTQRFFQPPNVPVMPGMPATPVMVQVGSELAPEETEEVTSVFMVCHCTKWEGYS